MREAGPSVLGALDYVWGRVRGRMDGLTVAEYRWEPVPDCWSVRELDSGWRIERVIPDPDPAPVTTIAWRLWHIGSDCLAGYTANGLGEWPLEVRDREWYGEPGPALAAVDQAWAAFRSGLDALGEDGLWRPLGPDWGQFGVEPWLNLALHAMDELAHHGAELALLRDLYRSGHAGA